MKVIRKDIADYLDVSSDLSESYSLMGTGYNTLNETPGAQTEEKTYINDTTSTTTIKSYKSQFPFDTDLIVKEAEAKTIEKLYYTGRNHLVGSDAETYYVRVDLFDPVVDGNTRYFKARKFKVAIEVSNVNGAGGETMVCSGNLNCIGDPILGFFDIVTKKFTAGDYVAPVLGTLTISSAAGSATGKTKITVSPSLTSGNKYVYKAASTVTSPAYGDDCSSYTAWDGTSEITATTGNKICIVEVDSNKTAVKAGIATVTAA